MIQDFTCPRCGGCRFGTEDPTLPSAEWVRHCREENNCDFTWPIADDALYLQEYEYELRQLKEALKILKRHVVLGERRLAAYEKAQK